MWFLTNLNSSWNTRDKHKPIFTCFQDCREILENSLFIVGEIGGNDYNYGFLIGKSIPEIKKNSPPCYQCYLLNNCGIVQFGSQNVSSARKVSNWMFCCIFNEI
jgi:hypothetical protein